MRKEYTEFLKSKVRLAQSTGFNVEMEEISDRLKPHNRLMVKWLVEGGRRACFAKFGLHKTVTQLETVRITLTKTGGRGLIIAPLGVRQEFRQDAVNVLGWEEGPKFIRRIEEAGETGIYITNYETIRDGKLDPRLFQVASLDEASVLRGFGGTKTFREFMRLFTGDAGPLGDRRGTECVPYRFVATATPSPNDYIELLAYADFLGIMDVSQAKAQPVDSTLFTANGPILMGDVKVGDKIISVDGTDTEVLGVYPQGVRDCYRITFNDGSTVECDEDHLWETQTQYQRNAYQKFLKGTGRKSDKKRNTEENYFTVRTTRQIIDTIEDCHSVSNTKPVQFTKKELPIDPYLLGVLLGDGYLRKVNVLFSSADQYIIDEVVKRVPDGLEVKHLKNYDYHIRNPKGRGSRNSLVSSLRNLGLCGKRSHEKFVPKEYLYNSIEDRLLLLQGLMDTDGTVCKINGPSFTSSSKSLIDAIIFLVQSLGGVARMHETKTKGRKAWRVLITLPNEINPFLIPRKRAIVKPKIRHGLCRMIRSIEVVGKKEMQCIAISHPKRLYLTDNFIVTHNTRFFKRDSTQADKLTIHKHKEEEFWLWVASWALFVSKPSDLTGNPIDDEGYNLPPLDLRWHELPSDHSTAGAEKSGQGRLFKNLAIGISDAPREKRESLQARIAKMLELREDNPEAHRIIWHDLEAERHAIEKAIPTITSIYGAQDLEEREEAIINFSYGKYQELAAKPVIAGSGCNFQRHCSWAIYLGIGFKFNDFIQSIHRLLRFLQKNQVRIDLIYTEAEREIRRQLERKWNQHNHQEKVMTEIIKKYGLSHQAMAQHLTRKMGVERVEITGQHYRIVNNDCVVESKRLASDSIGLILTSIPFSTQYEYSPNYADFGHTENNEEFFEQMDYLTPELYRSLMPGRICAVHVKDRIVPGGMTGLGFQTVYPFHLHTIQHYTRHGFAYIGMKTIVTDVVRENNQTYRLGWTEQCKDGSKMGVGMPEYLLLFRKPPSDTSNAYADIPVVKSKDRYTRSRWQIDAHAFARSNGNRYLNPDEIAQLDHAQIFKVFRDYTMNEVYDFEHHVTIAETLDLHGKLPSSFMLLQPASWSDEVWTDITRMLTLNGSQWSKGKEMHLCPFQFDIVDRVIEQMSNPGDTILDPFGGLMTVPVRAIKQGRKGIAFELNPSYFLDGAAYCKAAEAEISVPTLFDFAEL